jgi:hypothetical protein
MAYPTAIGCGCLLGAGGMSQLVAAEWSLQPMISVLADYDSDRNLAPNGGLGGSEESVLYTDLRLQRAIEDTQIVIEPRFDVRRYSASIWGPGNDRSLNSSFSYQGPRSKFTFAASIADQTTLTTELTETGIINGSTRRRTPQASTEWDWSQTERRQFFVLASFMVASYSGPPLVRLELPGYHYTNGAAGERFFLTEHWTLSASAFGDVLTSARQGGSSHEEGGQLEISYQYSEQTLFDLAVGESERSLSDQASTNTNGASQGQFSHQTSTGTNVSFTATRTLERGSASVSYVRSLVPYGTGFLVQRQQAAATLIRPLAPDLDFNISLLRIQNNAATVRLGLDRPYYNSAQLGLNWKMGESWSLQPALTVSTSKPIGPLGSTHTEPSVFQWRAGVTLVWQPLPGTKSR